MINASVFANIRALLLKAEGAASEEELKALEQSEADFRNSVDQHIADTVRAQLGGLPNAGEVKDMITQAVADFMANNPPADAKLAHIGVSQADFDALGERVTSLDEDLTDIETALEGSSAVKPAPVPPEEEPPPPPVEAPPAPPAEEPAPELPPVVEPSPEDDPETPPVAEGGDVAPAAEDGTTVAPAGDESQPI